LDIDAADRNLAVGRIVRLVFSPVLERFRAKWIPVRVKKTRLPGREKEKARAIGAGLSLGPSAAGLTPPACPRPA
jgi:hypothetical protein